MRGVAALLVGGALFGGCAGHDDLERGARYVDDPGFREAALAASFVDPDNGYSTLRLARYGEDWASLAAWNPPVRPLTEADLGAFVEAPLRPSTTAERPSSRRRPPGPRRRSSPSGGAPSRATPCSSPT